MDQSYAPSRYEKSTLLEIAVLLIVRDLHGLQAYKGLPTGFFRLQINAWNTIPTSTILKRFNLFHLKEKTI